MTHNRIYLDKPNIIIFNILYYYIFTVIITAINTEVFKFINVLIIIIDVTALTTT